MNFTKEKMGVKQNNKHNNSYIILVPQNVATNNVLKYPPVQHETNTSYKRQNFGAHDYYCRFWQKLATLRVSSGLDTKAHQQFSQPSLALVFTQNGRQHKIVYRGSGKKGNCACGTSRSALSRVNVAEQPSKRLHGVSGVRC